MVYANKKNIVLLVLFVVFNIELSEVISFCVSVLSEHFLYHNNTDNHDFFFDNLTTTIVILKISSSFIFTKDCT